MDTVKQYTITLTGDSGRYLDRDMIKMLLTTEAKLDGVVFAEEVLIEKK